MNQVSVAEYSKYKCYLYQTTTSFCNTTEVSAKPKKRLTVQMDELWSFVDDLGNEQWVWLAKDAQTREIVGVHIGDRSALSAQALWKSMPPGIDNVL